MSYKAEISRKNPTAFVFLIDQSGSMGAESGINDENGNPVPKAQAVSDAINSLIEELINRCQKREGINDYFDIALLGYGQKSNEAYFAWEGDLKGNDWCTISQLKTNFVDEIKYNIEVVIRGKIETEKQTKKIWINPVAHGITPMKAALIQTKELLEDWIKDHKDSFPPIVINITDAWATDISNKQELIDVANDIKSLQTTDGNVIVFNCHIAGSKAQPTIFPSSIDDLPDDEHAYTLFSMSSELPEQYINLIIEIFGKEALTYKHAWGMAYNSPITALIKLLDIGTRVAVIKTANDDKAEQ